MHHLKFLLSFASVVLATAISTPENAHPLVARQGSFIRYAGCFGSWFDWLSNPSTYNLALAFSSPTNGISTCSTACPTSSHFILWGPDCLCAPNIFINTTMHYIPSLDSWEATEGDCWRSCQNEPGVPCGGSMRASFYARTEPPSAQDPGIATIPGFHWMGCYPDLVPNRNLHRKHSDSPSMTPLQCASLCPQSNYIGLEYGRECWCGPVLKYSYRTFLRLCPKVCEGDTKYLCGGNKHLTLYEKDGVKLPGEAVGGYEYLGCYTDLVNGTRALGNVYKSDGMTLEVCAERAESRGEKYFGVEYGRECWTGNTLSSTSTALWDYTECNFPCGGNAGQACGAGSKLSLYIRPT
ncbi:WSC domain-containing protein [Podospora fimiseda]|uniref:WSC domain-containing protein n=1 Tax=Podospora fimiseda TaxID=252190 RepID=A0AAN7BLR3_9PEZI|nr:WSC domain-containing protein [Podospora fimiseda]